MRYLIAICFLYGTVNTSGQDFTKDQNQLVLYRTTDHNKVEVIMESFKVKVKMKEGKLVNDNSFKIKEIKPNELISESGETVKIEDIAWIKSKTLGRDNKRSGWGVLAFGALMGGGFYALDTYVDPPNLGTSVLMLFSGFTAIVAGVYGSINLLVGTIKANGTYDLEKDWKPEVEKRNYYKPGKVDTVK